MLLSDVRGFVFEVFGAENDTQHRKTLPIVPRSMPELIRESFHIIEERHWEWISDLPGEGKLGRGYDVVGYVLNTEK